MLRSIIAAAVATLLVSSAGAAAAQVGADLNISPRRVTFDEGERSASVYVFNQGDVAATYTVELVDRAMAPDGQIRAVSEAPDAPHSPSAADFIQYTPRRITLQPKESQVVRLRVRPPTDETVPEYRTHLTVTALPPEDSGFTAAQAAQANPGEVALQVVALFSVSIPLIVRDGAVDARASVENLNLIAPAEGAPNGAIGLDLVRLGANSVYGDVEIRAGSGATERVVGLVRGIAVYPEIARRTVAAPLASPVAAGETVRVLYRDDDAKPGSELATATFTAP